jgi:hypothetical protein
MGHTHLWVGYDIARSERTPPLAKLPNTRAAG